MSNIPGRATPPNGTLGASGSGAIEAVTGSSFSVVLVKPSEIPLTPDVAGADGCSGALAISSCDSVLGCGSGSGSGTGLCSCCISVVRS